MTSNESVDAITHEVDRILSCRYAVQLKSLHNVVIAAAPHEIEIWASQRPTQIASLVLHVINALESWAYVSELVIIFSSCRAVRDCFLDTDPRLLEHTVSEASEGQDDTATRLAIALLQHELGPAHPLPSSAQRLLKQLFDRAVETPTTASIVPLYAFVFGGGRPILDILPTTKVAEFAKHVLRILGEANDKQTPSLSLYCLTILGLFCGRINPLGKGPSALRGEHNINAATSFFTGAKAHKTLHLLALRVIWACKTEAQRDIAAEATTCVTLASHIVAGIETSIRRNWAANNPALIDKIHERASKPDLQSEMAFQILTFIGVLCESSHISEGVIARYNALLVPGTRLALSDTTFDTAIRLALSSFASRFTSQQWQDILDVALTTCLDQPLAASNCARIRITSVLSVAGRRLDDLPSLQQTLLHILGGSCLAQQLRRLCSELPTAVSEQPDLHQSVGMLGKTICSLLLGGLAYVKQASSQRTLPHDIAHLLQAYTSMSTLLTAARIIPRSKDQAQGSSMQQRRIDTVDLPKDINWRECISSVVQNQAEQQKQTMINMFTEFCRDLEERCNNVEAPLRAERQQNAELTTSAEEYRQAYEHIESRMMDQDICVASLQKEHERLTGSLSSCSSERERAFERIQKAEEQLQNAQRSAQSEINFLRQKLGEVEMSAATRSACAQEVIDTSREETRMLKQKLLSVDSQLAQCSSALVSKEQDAVDLATRLAAQTSRADSMQTQLRGLTVEQQDSSAANKQLHEQVRARDADISTLQQNLQRAIQTAEENNVTHQQDIARLHTDFEDRLANDRQQWTIRLSDQAQAAEQLQAEAAQETADLTAQVSELETQLSRARKKIDRLSADCTKKDAQVLEAQEMRNRLMSAMGLAARAEVSDTAGTVATPRQSTLPIRSLSSAGETGTPDRTIVAPPHRRAESEVRVAEESLVTDRDPDAQRSLKRVRPRRLGPAAFKIPAMDPRRATYAKKMQVSQSTRRPLGDVDGNVSRAATSPSRRCGDADAEKAVRDMDSTYASIETGRRENGAGEMEDDKIFGLADRDALVEWSFDGEEITSTPGIGLEMPVDAVALLSRQSVEDKLVRHSESRQSTGEVVRSILVEMGGLDEDLISTVSA